MLENNNHNLHCNYSEQLISFLYGEIENADKINFETHLLNCNACAGELAGFSSLRTTIQDWRQADFEILASPIIEISLVPDSYAVKESSHWLEKVRSFFALYNRSLAGGLAAFLILIGFIWFGSSLINNNEIARSNSNKEIKKEISTPSVEQLDKKLPASEKKELLTVSNETMISSSRKTSKSRTLPAVKHAVLQESKRKLATSMTVTKKPVVSNTNRQEQIARKTIDRNRIQTVTTDDDEDNSLRLADILDEVSMK